MDFPPSEWEIFPANAFELAEPRDPGEHGVEVMVQVRNNGRILDHFRLAVGGSGMLEARFKLKDVMIHEKLPNWELVYRLWPRDIKLRRNMTTSEWVDIKDLVSARDVAIGDLDNSEEVEAARYLEFMDSLGSAKSKISCALRWGVCAGPDQRVHLHLQAMPAALETFSGKPALKG